MTEELIKTNNKSKSVKRSNAQRFIDAYNKIDHSLRAQHDFKRSLSYSDMIRRAVSINYIVRKYEDDLVDFGRLRNAIIHGKDEDRIIAEPHDDVVERFEHIAKIISTPPLAINTVCKKDVLCVQHNVSVGKVIELIYKSQFSNIPVFKGGELIGIANGQRILDVLGKIISEGKDLDEYVQKTTIEQAITEKVGSNYYTVKPVNSTVEAVMNEFFKNRKLLVIIISKNGTMNEIPLGIITTSDVIEMNNILDNY